jgi:quercetin dioxygenase-like cupin family protein
MKLYNRNNFIGGWFIGNFIPTIIPSNEVEVSIKRYKAGDYDQAHYHKEADEITVIVEGMVSMNKIKYHTDDILWIEKGDITDFLALTDAITCVVKMPSVKGDKYLTK